MSGSKGEFCPVLKEQICAELSRIMSFTFASRREQDSVSTDREGHQGLQEQATSEKRDFHE